MLKIKLIGKLPREIKGQELLDRTVEVLLEEDWSGRAKMALLERSEAKLKIAFRVITAPEMRKINKDTRGKDYATDVLSWGFWEDGMWPGQEEIGEVLICGEVAERQAEENGWKIEEEVAFLLIHGFLHVFGLDHELGEAAWKEQFDLHGLIMPQAQPMIEKLKKQTF